MLHEFANLLKLELDGSRIHARDSVSHILTDPKRLILCLPEKIDEK